MKIYNYISKEDLKYSLLFLFLTLFFWEISYTPLAKILESKFTYTPFILPKNYMEICFTINFVICFFTPFIILLFKRKYEIFFFGMLLPSFVFYIYSFILARGFIFYPVYFLYWYIQNDISVFLFLFLMRSSKNLKGDTIRLFLLPFIFLLGWVTVTDAPEDIAHYLVMGFFGAIYLILLSFIVEKIAKIKIFRHGA